MATCPRHKNPRTPTTPQRVEPPMFAASAKGDETENFYARINNRTEELTGQDSFGYQKRRWPH